jgi:hypothetical protein
MYTWKSASEGREIQAVVEKFVEGLKSVGKMNTEAFTLLEPATLDEIRNADVAGPDEVSEKVEA